MISERMQMTPENELQMVPAAQKRASRAPPGSCVSTPQAPLPSGWPSAAWRRCPGEGAAKWGRPSCVPEQKRGGGGAACHPPADLLGARPCPGALGERHLIPLAQEGGREPQNHSASEDDSTRGWPTSQGHLQPPCPLSPVLNCTGLLTVLAHSRRFLPQGLCTCQFLGLEGTFKLHPFKRTSLITWSNPSLSFLIKAHHLCPPHVSSQLGTMR